MTEAELLCAEIGELQRSLPGAGATGVGILELPPLRAIIVPGASGLVELRWPLSPASRTQLDDVLAAWRVGLIAGY